MVTKYSQRELSERDYVNDNPTDVATERPKKKSNLLRNLVVAGAIVGGLAGVAKKYEHEIVKNFLPNPIPAEMEYKGYTIKF